MLPQKFHLSSQENVKNITLIRTIGPPQERTLQLFKYSGVESLKEQFMQVANYPIRVMLTDDKTHRDRR